MKISVRKVTLSLTICALTMAFHKKDNPNQDGVHRIYQNKKYRLLDSSAIYIYERYAPTEIVKGKGLVMQYQYFFSRQRDGEIKALTIKNVEDVFPDNDRFRYLLESEFHNDGQLMAYDRYLHEYKLEYVYRESL